MSTNNPAIHALAVITKAQPLLRTGQIICNALTIHKGKSGHETDLYYISNEDLATILYDYLTATSPFTPK